ncbi:hypothetical protein [Dinghuibacter silviterrae]|uniref:Uncharacterized protein n=1 Tax=Dinghuibacter silviterrae TaxID=1539049 RepID=A0A4V3GKX6_9BACT|nr:hypothetical protein [Dinghuibacter silviterrae]TDW97342.1 hypothetical protein EDB95_5189 [Dinghuibacter silviterrae]
MEEQLTKDNIQPGTALDALVRANQDLTMLYPDEVNDALKQPPWIRIYFRKQHPELGPPGSRVAYPLAIRDIREWMVNHQDLPQTGDSSTSEKGGSHGH